ncbi:MAG: right-handed parallel beta-helix repeat-containing protein [Candidatus Scalindua sp.]|nr:right-handed parallel beta-helix repeat-containing protein [Candidatus Scalindua sp.]
MSNRAIKKRGTWTFNLMLSVLFISYSFFNLDRLDNLHAAEFTIPSGDAAALIDAINTANSSNEDDTINLQGGTYTLTRMDNDTNGPNGLPSVTSSITLKGTGADSTIIQRERDAPLFRIFHVADTGVLQIDSFTIKDGVVPYSLNDETETFDGGGIYNIGTVTIRNSSILDNEAHNGGGIANWSGLMSITNSTISYNGSDKGSGIKNYERIVTVENCTISQNGGAYYGNGIHNVLGTVSITNCTISDNHGPGAAITNGYGDYSGAGTVELKNTILAYNSADVDYPGDCEGPITSLGNNIIGDPVNCTIALLESDSTGDPRLREFIDDGLPGHGHVPLLLDSPAIDSGNNSACPQIDQLGKSRPVDGNGDGTAACDIGAIEFEYPENSYIRSPRPGSRFTDPTLATPTVEFEWVNGSAVSQHWLSVGTSLASLDRTPYGDIYSRNQYLNTSATVSGIPLNGQNLYVRLWFKSGTWKYVDYTYQTQ